MSSLEKYPSPFVVMGVGMPGSGKSTILKPFAEQTGAHYLCTDDIREELTGDAGNQTVNGRAWGLLYDRAAQYLQDGESMVVDATHTKAHERRAAILKYRDFGAETLVALCVEADVETAVARNQKRDRVVPEQVIRQMALSLQKNPVSLSEGFDDIIKIQNDA